MSPLSLVWLPALAAIGYIVYRHIRHRQAHPGGCAHCAAPNCPHRKRPRQNP